MKLYHRTTSQGAASILAGGFKDGAGHYLTSSTNTGVWLADCPLDANEGAQGEELLEVLLPNGFDLGPYEWVEEGKPYREFLVPAEQINRNAKIRRLCGLCDEGSERTATRTVQIGFFTGPACEDCVQEAGGANIHIAGQRPG